MQAEKKQRMCAVSSSSAAPRSRLWSVYGPILAEACPAFSSDLINFLCAFVYPEPFPVQLLNELDIKTVGIHRQLEHDPFYTLSTRQIHKHQPWIHLSFMYQKGVPRRTPPRFVDAMIANLTWMPWKPAWLRDEVEDHQNFALSQSQFKYKVNWHEEWHQRHPFCPRKPFD